MTPPPPLAHQVEATGADDLTTVRDVEIIFQDVHFIGALEHVPALRSLTRTCDGPCSRPCLLDGRRVGVCVHPLPFGAGVGVDTCARARVCVWACCTCAAVIQTGLREISGLVPVAHSLLRLVITEQHITRIEGLELPNLR